MSLGWLGGSNILPKKRKFIEGVTGNTMVELKALLYEHQSNAKNKKKISKSTPDQLGGKNKGLENRIQKDDMSVKQETKGQNSLENLEKKAKLYRKLATGEIQEGEDVMVDFIRKSDSDFIDHGPSMRLDLPQNDTIDDKVIIPLNSSQKTSDIRDFSTISARAKVKQMRNEKKFKNQKRQQKLKEIKAREDKNK